MQLKNLLLLLLLSLSAWANDRPLTDCPVAFSNHDFESYVSSVDAEISNGVPSFEAIQAALEVRSGTLSSFRPEWETLKKLATQWGVTSPQKQGWLSKILTKSDSLGFLARNAQRVLADGSNPLNRLIIARYIVESLGQKWRLEFESTKAIVDLFFKSFVQSLSKPDFASTDALLAHFVSLFNGYIEAVSQHCDQIPDVRQRVRLYSDFLTLTRGYFGSADLIPLAEGLIRDQLNPAGGQNPQATALVLLDVLISKGVRPDLVRSIPAEQNPVALPAWPMILRRLVSISAVDSEFRSKFFPHLEGLLNKQTPVTQSPVADLQPMTLDSVGLAEILAAGVTPKNLLRVIRHLERSKISIKAFDTQDYEALSGFYDQLTDDQRKDLILHLAKINDQGNTTFLSAVIEIYWKEQKRANSSSKVLASLKQLPALLRENGFKRVLGTIKSGGEVEPLEALVLSGLLDQSGASSILATSYSGMSEAQLQYLVEQFPAVRAKVNAAKIEEFLVHPGVNPDQVAMVIGNQTEINQLLMDQLKDVVQANAPPKGSRSLQEYFAKIPARERQGLATQLLQANARTAAAAAALIAELPPIEGVIEAVQLFLASSPLMQGNRSQFSHEQAQQMFGSNDRFAKFFPHIYRTPLTGAIRTKLIIAVFTSPILPETSTLSFTWVSEKLDDDSVQEGVSQAVGYRPALRYDRFLRHLENNFVGNVYGETPIMQIRGLTVQGGYAKIGHSLMDANERTRGNSHVEDLAPGVANALEENLGSGQLSQVSTLDRKLFVQNWAISRDGGLIGNIRSRAVYLENVRGFWGIRVEIHNFPTFETLRKCREFRRTHQLSNERAAQLDALIREIETLLGTARTLNGVNELLDQLPSGDTIRAAVNEKLAGFDRANHASQLAKINEARKVWREMKPNGTSNMRLTETWKGDGLFTQVSMTKGSEALEAFKKSANSASVNQLMALTKPILESVALDFEVDQAVFNRYLAELEKVTSDGKLDPTQRFDLIYRLISNFVDRVTFDLKARYGKMDDLTFRFVQRPEDRVPGRFVDSTLRSSNAIVAAELAALVQKMAYPKSSVTISGTQSQAQGTVHNPGEAIGILRLNANPMAVSKDDIAVFDEQPTQALPMAGMINLSEGAQLSHLQLLAKALGVPNVSMPARLKGELRALNGKRIIMRASSEGEISIEAVSGDRKSKESKTAGVEVPVPDHTVSTPVSSDDLASARLSFAAGPKSHMLAKLRTNPKLARYVMPSVTFPFGYFDAYANQTNLRPLLNLLPQIGIGNDYLTSLVAYKIRSHINETRLPEPLRDQAVNALVQYQSRLGGESLSAFVRSDTNMEDLAGFNGAGLNETVPNVLFEASNPEPFERALRTVWRSPYTQRSILWRATVVNGQTQLASGPKANPVVEPSVQVLKTLKAMASGVLLYRPGKASWVNSDHGIGSVVSTGTPVDSFVVFPNSTMVHQYSTTLSTTANYAAGSSGLASEAAPVHASLTQDGVRELIALGAEVNATLGDSPYGWDVEWVFDGQQFWIVQARPAPKDDAP